MKKEIIILSLALLAVGISACKKDGCTNPLAENYEKKADTDDGSCTFADNVIGDEITDDITVPTTLEAQTYKICTDIYVSSELILSPGTKLIMCEGSSITVESSGFFNATGTAEKPIVIKGETTAKGFWAGIAFKSNNPNNKLIHATVSDGGTYWGWEYATVYVADNAQLNISNSTVSNSDNYGLFVDDGGSLSLFADNTFADNTTGLSLQVDQVSKIDGNSNYNSANVNDYVEVRAGTIGIAQTWKATSTPLLISNVTIDGSLELLPGSNIMVEADQYISVSTSGYLSSVGTVADPISIKGRYESAGYWSGIKIGSNNPNNKIAHTTIADGGQYWAYEYANILIDGRLDIENSTIKNANSYGIYLNSGSSIFANGTLQPNAGVVEAHNTFIGNGAGADANCTNGCTIFFE